VESIKKLFWISRPVSWVNTAYPFAAGYIVTGGAVNWFFALTTLYFLIPYNLLMYGVNDVFDYESDIRNPRKGGIEGMREQKAFHPTIMWAALLCNVPFVIYILMQIDNTARLIFTALLFFVVAYSIAKLRFKERPVLDSVTSSIHFVGPLFFALVLTGWKPVYIPYVVAFFFWGIASHALGAVQDINPDRKAKISSIATFFGARTTTRFAFLLYISASGILIFQNIPSAVVGIAGLGYALNISNYLDITDKNSGTINKAWRRFIWLNLFTGFVITMVLIVARLY